jgi:hypothetical protein
VVRRYFIAEALEVRVLKRSLKVSVFVGTILMLINHGDKILNGTIGMEILIKIAVTYCVPFCVSTYSSVSARRSLER